MSEKESHPLSQLLPLVGENGSLGQKIPMPSDASGVWKNRSPSVGKMVPSVRKSPCPQMLARLEETLPVG